MLIVVTPPYPTMITGVNKMSSKKIIVGTCVLVIVVLIVIISEALTSIRPPEHRTRFFPTLEERHIEAIVINEGGSSIRIDRCPCGWMVGPVSDEPAADPAGKNIEDLADNVSDGDDVDADSVVINRRVPADSALVQIAIERILSLRKGSVISDNPANRAAFEVDNREGGSSIEVYVRDRENPAGILIIGKGGPDWNSNYVRMDGTNEVYLIAGGLRQALFFDLERWKKKVVEPEPENGDEDDDHVVAENHQ
jgi:hypothetical protein